MIRRPPSSTLFPTRRSSDLSRPAAEVVTGLIDSLRPQLEQSGDWDTVSELGRDRKSTRLNSSHPSISYAVFCLKKKKINKKQKVIQQPHSKSRFYSLLYGTM